MDSVRNSRMLAGTSYTDQFARHARIWIRLQWQRYVKAPDANSVRLIVSCNKIAQASRWHRV